MATPKKRVSPPRSGNRRRNIFLTLPTTRVCQNCGAQALRHQSCPSCGYYRGRLVVSGRSSKLAAK